MTPIKMIERLIAFNTVSRDSNLELIEFVEEYLHSHGIASTRVPNDTGAAHCTVCRMTPRCGTLYRVPNDTAVQHTVPCAE